METVMLFPATKQMRAETAPGISSFTVSPELADGFFINLMNPFEEKPEAELLHVIFVSLLDKFVFSLFFHAQQEEKLFPKRFRILKEKARYPIDNRFFQIQVKTGHNRLFRCHCLNISKPLSLG